MSRVGPLLTERRTISRNGASDHAVFEFPAEVRKVIYTTNAVESLNMSLCKITKDTRLVSE